jgi:hypothetical protein
MATPAVPGRMLEAPQARGLVKRVPARVMVRVPAWRSRLRRDDSLVRLRLRPGPVTSLGLRLTGVPGFARENFRRPGEVAQRLAAIRRERTVRVWLNGRRVTRALDRSQPTRWRASLSASHGLRYGVNRLRILVAEPDRGRYALLRRRFVVHRNHHLAAAGWDVATSVGGRVRLDGRRSQAARGRQTRHRWRIISKPRGSRAQLRRAGSARPLLTPDRRGHYVIGLTVTDRGKRAKAAQAEPASADTVTVTAGPQSLLVPFKGLTVEGGAAGIKVGGRFYPNPTGGSGLQWLTLDRSTLTPTGTGNSWIDSSGKDPGHGLGKLTSVLCPPDPAHPDCNAGVDQLVILSYQDYGQTHVPAVGQDQIDAFNAAIKVLGAGPIDADVLQDGNKLVIVGVPFGGDGSGKYTHGGGAVDALTGWLMPDTALDGSKAFRFRFQPERPEFDTQASHTSTTNTMNLAGRQLPATLPAGATGGFQVQFLDPVDLRPVAQDVFATNGVADPVAGINAMTSYLKGAAGQPHLVVQSIGQVAPTAVPHGPFERDPGLHAWYELAQALTAFGANPHTFSTVDGSYAFFGGARLDRGDVADSSSAVEIDDTTHESGTLQGRASMRQDGVWLPTIAHGSDSFESSLYDIVFRSPTPWPYTTGGAFPRQKSCPAPGNDTAAYAKALSYVATGLNFASYASDLRMAYVKRDQDLTWSDQKTDLTALEFESGHGFGEAEFCNLKAQLQIEFTWLDNVKGLFDTYQDALIRSGAPSSDQLQTIGDNIRKAVPVDDGAEIGWSVGGFTGNLVSALILAAAPEATPALAAWEAMVVAYELVRELVSQEGGAPLGDKVTSKVDDLASEVTQRLFDTANGLDRLRQVIVSDYGRLGSLGPVVNDADWSVDRADTAVRLTAAARAFFYSKLMPIPYGVYALVKEYPYDFDGNPDNCYDEKYGHTWRGAPATAQMKWMGGFALDGQSVQEGSTPFVLGKHSLSVTSYSYPPASLTDPMFRPVAQGGAGVQLPQFIWESFEAPAGETYPPTDIGQCH